MNELFQALPKLIDDFKEKPGFLESVVFAAWRKIAGESLSEHTVPFRLFGKHLIIAVADKMWKRHLETLSGDMIFRINSLLKQEVVKFIEFRIDEELVKSERSKEKNQLMSDEELREIALDKITPKLRHSADAIKDDNLRYQFLLAAGSCLARKEKLKEKDK